MIPRSLLSCAALFATLPLPPLAHAEDASGVRIVNVAADFLAYHQACADADAAERVARWEELLEAKHPDFFRDAVYRKKQGAERDRFKTWCITTFWSDVAPKIAAIRTLADAMPAQIAAVVGSFRKQFPDFKPTTDFYVTVSLTFRGKVMDVAGKPVFGIGLDQLDAKQPHQIQITIAHELFHLYHFQTFSPKGGLYRVLWAEALASYASAVVVPGHRMSGYLGFSGEKMNRCQDLLPRMARELKEKMGENDERLRRIYFGAEPNDTPIPPEAGYYVGWLIAQSLAKKRSLADLARLEAKAVYPLVEDELARLAEGK